MTVQEAIYEIIINDCECEAIIQLTKSLNNKRSIAENKMLDRGARIRAIKKINERNNNANERREGIDALCDLESEEQK